MASRKPGRAESSRTKTRAAKARPKASRRPADPAARGAGRSVPDARPIAERVGEALAWLEARSTRRDRDNLARFGITAKNALGVSMANIQLLAKRLGRSHALALALWKTGVYEARLLCAFVDEPERVTPAQMERWCRDFDNWGICDTLCFKLWDRTPHAWAKVEAWARREEEFVKRTAFALLASLALHDESSADRPFLRALPIVERAALDERNFVWKGVSWALRAIGRRSAGLRSAALASAERLAISPAPSARRVGKEALKELGRPARSTRGGATRAGGSPR